MSQDQTKAKSLITPLFSRKQPVVDQKTVKSVPSDNELKESQQQQSKSQPIKEQSVSQPTKSQSQLNREEGSGESRAHSRSRSRNKQRKVKQQHKKNRQNDRHDKGNSRNDRSKQQQSRSNRDRSRHDRQHQRQRDHGRHDDSQKNTTYYKTKLCPAYLNGKCQKQGKCSFAHGQSQLRQMPNFKKTKLCLQFIHGKCPYSSRQCKYAHGQAQLKRNQGSTSHSSQNSKHNYQQVNSKYRISTYDPYAHSAPYPSGPLPYGHLSGGPSYPSPSGMPGMAPPYPMPTNRTGYPVYDRPNPGSWAGGYPSPWPTASVRPELGPGSMPTQPSFPQNFDPQTIFRSWELPPGSSTLSRSDGLIPGNSAPMFLPPNTFGSTNSTSYGTGSTPSHYPSGLYGGTPPSVPVPYYHTPITSGTGSTFEPFPMGMGQPMPRRMPLNPER